MREVAERADVALGTVYHYFGSKDHLLAESLAEWIRGLAANVARNPARGDTTLERVLDLLGRVTRAMQKQPEGKRRPHRRVGGTGRAGGGLPAGHARDLQRDAGNRVSR